MTVTQRRARGDPNNPDARGAPESGSKVTCDFCHIDVTNTVRFRCADPACKALDICPVCFCEGKRGTVHRPWHDYTVEQHLSTPIFSEDWGADEEISLISGLITYGLGNWAEVAGHVGTRTKEECESHYLQVYIGVNEDAESLELKDGTEVDGFKDGIADEDSRKRRREFMPPMDKYFDVDAEEFAVRKKARIEAMRQPQLLPPSGPLVSAPTNHEVAGFMPGRLEFEHEVENDAEMAIKDMEFGLVYKYGGDEQPLAKVTKPPGEDDDDDSDEDEGEKGEGSGKKENGDTSNTDIEIKVEPVDPPDTSTSAGTGTPDGSKKKDKGKGKAKGPVVPDIEDEDELDLKLALLDIYFSKLDKREEAKDIIFDRGLTEHKRIQATERKRPKDERELVQRYKVFAKLQTAQDFEVLIEGLVCEFPGRATLTTDEQILRKRIAELQEYRRMGVTTAFEAEAYENQKISRAGYRLAPGSRIDRPAEVLTGARVNAGQHRFLHGISTPPPDKNNREQTPRVISGTIPRKPVTPLNLASSTSLDLLSPEEQTLCSNLRVLPKPYLLIKEGLIVENQRRNGLLKRRDARKMNKIDVNKTGRIFDFLVQNGMLPLAYDPAATKLAAQQAKEGIVPMITEIHASPKGVNGVQVNGFHPNGHGLG